MESSKVEREPVLGFRAGPHLAFTPNSAYLLTSSDHGPQLWDTRTWTKTGEAGALAGLREAGGPVAFCRLAGEGQTLLATAQEAGVVALYEFSPRTDAAPAPRLLARLESPERQRAEALTFNAQGSRLAAACADRIVLVWDLARLRRELFKRGLAGDLPDSAVAADAPLTVTFASSPSRGAVSGP
jgi:WD40 repeat protein